MQRIRKFAIARTLITAIAKAADSAAVALASSRAPTKPLPLKRLDKWRKKNPNLP